MSQNPSHFIATESTSIEPSEHLDLGWLWIYPNDFVLNTWNLEGLLNMSLCMFSNSRVDKIYSYTIQSIGILFYRFWMLNTKIPRVTVFFLNSYIFPLPLGILNINFNKGSRNQYEEHILLPLSSSLLHKPNYLIKYLLNCKKSCLINAPSIKINSNPNSSAIYYVTVGIDKI